MTTLTAVPKRVLLGRPLRNENLHDELLPKRIALPVFCSDPLSSNAYATEEILLVLSIGGLALLHLAPWVAVAVALLLVVVVASYRQTCHAYPNGGGAYAVSRANLGRRPALVAASALLVDYVLTVAVSVAAGVANVVSAFPALAPHAVALSLACIALLTVMNLRGVRESGRLFALPTYGFIATVLLMIGVGGWQVLTSSPPIRDDPPVPHRGPPGGGAAPSGVRGSEDLHSGVRDRAGRVTSWRLRRGSACGREAPAPRPAALRPGQDRRTAAPLAPPRGAAARGR
jgi:hypothetical protein